VCGAHERGKEGDTIDLANWSVAEGYSRLRLPDFKTISTLIIIIIIIIIIRAQWVWER